MMGSDNSFAIYDPISSKILMGDDVISTFVFRATEGAKEAVEADPDAMTLELSFGVRKTKIAEGEEADGADTSIIDIRSIMNLLKK